MNIAIGILGLIDTILLYVIDIKEGDVGAEILIDVLGTVFYLIVWNYILSDNERAVPFFKWVVFISLIVTLCGIIFSIIKGQYRGIQTNFSADIPQTLSYFILLIKRKIEGED